MAKFVFQLEAVLRHRKHEEQERQRLLGDAQAEMTRLEAELRRLDASVQANTDDLRNNHLTGALDMRYLAAHRRFALAMQQTAMGVVQQMARQQVKVDEARRALGEAAKERKIIEKLRERHLERWRAEQAQKEALAMDEASTQLSYRQMTAGGEASS